MSNLAQLQVPGATNLEISTTAENDGGLVDALTDAGSYPRWASQFALTASPLALGDVIALSISILVALSGVEWLGWAGHAEPARYLVLLAASLVMVFSLLGLYPGIGLHPIVELRLTSIGITVVWCINLVASLVSTKDDDYTALTLAITWPLCLVAVPLARVAVRTVFSRCDWWRQPALVFGTGASATEIYDSLRKNGRLGLRPVAKVQAERFDEADLLAGAARKVPIRRADVISWAVIAMPECGRDELLRTVERCAGLYPNILVVPDVKGLPTLWTSAHDFGGVPGLKVQDRLLMPVPRLIKWLLDILMTAVGGLVALPLIVAISLSIRLGSSGPVFYSQQRIGHGGRRFHAWKFRTMVPNADQVLQDVLQKDPVLRAEWQRDHKLRNDPRVTRVGRWLRKTSLDELPQIWNVLRGEMSLVGPRPIVDAEVAKYGDRFELYTKVRPGISGLWQVSGRNDTTYRERVELDTFYVRNWSPWLDLYILAATARVVLFREGAY